MKKKNLHEAKTHLSKLVDLVAQGEEIVICKAGNPVAVLIAYKPKKGKRNLGVLKGKIKIEDDFDVLPEEFMSYFK